MREEYHKLVSLAARGRDSLRCLSLPSRKGHTSPFRSAF
jgi:hypothetical protein